MPYIKQDRRVFLNDPFFNEPENCGELNYCITRQLIDQDGSPDPDPILAMCLGYWAMEGKRNYQAINDVVGALDHAAFEYVRRIGHLPSREYTRIKVAFYIKIAIPYENEKIKENGDIEGYENALPSEPGQSD